MDIAPPGITEARRWVAGLSAPPPKNGVYVLAGAGVKRRQAVIPRVSAG
jgi:hypothetical protein